jgi:hypothetical protein
MHSQSLVPAGAALAIDDMLDHCAGIQPGQEVLLLAHIDGLYGGDNMVDEQTIAWIQAAVESRGAHSSVLWINEPGIPHAWRLPPVVKGAIQNCDVLINHSFDIVVEENVEFRELCYAKKGLVMVRNFATTAPLLCTAWAQTPYELVSEIRYQALKNYKEGLAWQLTDDNGTHLEGKINSPTPDHSWSVPYLTRREEAGPYRPWPEWVHTPIRIAETNGIFVFDCMLSWWSRYIGISPYFSSPIRLTIKDNRMVKIEGGDEAEGLRRFLASMRERLGDRVFDFDHIHSGVHPQAIVAPHQCPSALYRRVIEHSHSSNIHLHIGGPPPVPGYPYWMHITGDTRTGTFKVGDNLVHDHGHLTALDDPAVLAVAARYPGRPGLGQEPRSF